MPEVPVTGGSALGRALTWALLPSVLLAPGPGAAPDGRLRRAVREARTWVDDAWGPRPRPEVRLAGRGLLRGSCYLAFGGTFLPAMVLFGVGIALDLRWLQVLAAGVVVVGSSYLGILLAMLRTQYGTIRDHQEWEHAGCPQEWTYRASSQPRTGDLVAMVVLSTLLAAFFVKLMLW